AKAAKFREPVIAALGIAFKADVDDLRESPSKSIVERLSAEIEHAQVLVVEPNVEALPASLADRANVEHAEVGDAIERADIVLVLVDHHQFKTLDRELLTEKIVVDTKGLWR
ncbi:UDP binding domain-containing protein, partial [Microbacterium sp.]|uniref:UDP binding domain-containing protein n=1 Tax=Microbacterium sp. TaxID=51671 RepID=UPI0028119B18